MTWLVSHNLPGTKYGQNLSNTKLIFIQQTFNNCYRPNVEPWVQEYKDTLHIVFCSQEIHSIVKKAQEFYGLWSPSDLSLSSLFSNYLNKV